MNTRFFKTSLESHKFIIVLMMGLSTFLISACSLDARIESSNLGNLIDPTNPTTPTNPLNNSMNMQTNSPANYSYKAAFAPFSFSPAAGKVATDYSYRYVTNPDQTPYTNWIPFQTSSAPQLPISLALTHGYINNFSEYLLTSTGWSFNSDISYIIQVKDNSEDEITSSLSVTVPSEVDCISGSPVPGDLCIGGGIYAGEVGGEKYITTYPGCIYSGAAQSYDPFFANISGWIQSDFGVACNNYEDYFAPNYNGNWSVNDTNSISNLSIVTTPDTDDANQGDFNTNLVSNLSWFNDTSGGYSWLAPKYCKNMVAHGQSDWFLPNNVELDLLYSNKNQIGGFRDAIYASSSFTAFNYFVGQNFSSGNRSAQYAVTPAYIRCVRKLSGEDTPAPPPTNSTTNLMASSLSGGTASIKEIGIVSGPGSVYNSTVHGPCSGIWTPSGTLCSYPEDTAEGVVYASYGATWSIGGNPTTIGYLIIDLGETKEIGTFEVFQMHSDGKTSHLQIFAHPDLSANLPTQLDAGWSEITSGMTAVGAGVLDLNAGLIKSPLIIQPSTSVTTRYLKIHAMNDGSLGSTNYIELRSVRAFAP